VDPLRRISALVLCFGKVCKRVIASAYAALLNSSFEYTK